MSIDNTTLERLQRVSFGYFVHETDPANGLIIDKTAPDWPASIAAVGLALASYPVGVERGFMTRAARHFGLNQGPIVLMIENHRTGLVWQLVRRCAPIVSGLRRAEFRGGWL